MQSNIAVLLHTPEHSESSTECRLSLPQGGNAVGPWLCSPLYLCAPHPVPEPGATLLAEQRHSALAGQTQKQMGQSDSISTIRMKKY